MRCVWEVYEGVAPPEVLDVLLLRPLGLMAVDVATTSLMWETLSESAFHTEGDEAMSLAAISGGEIRFRHRASVRRTR